MAKKYQFKKELEKNGTVTLCAGQKCCPVISKEKEGYSIKDDFGGEVKLTADQWEMLGSIFDKS